MVEERFCPHCGRANPRTMPRCMNCGQRIIKGGVSSERERAGGTLLLEEEETVPTETSHTPWWQLNADSSVPPPPQVREQLARAESKQRDLERIAEQERLFQERLRLHESSRERLKMQERAPSWEPKSPTGGVCWRCGTATGEAGAKFSFCLNCGADVSAGKQGDGTGTPGRFTSAAAPGYTSAFQTTQRQQQRTQQQTTVNPNVQHSTVSPVAAALFSFFIPGVGQFMNGQASKGVLLMLAGIVFGIITGMALPISGLIRLGVSIIAAIDAYRVAERRREGKPVRREEWDLG